MARILTTALYRARTTVPVEWVDDVIAQNPSAPGEPDWVQEQLDMWQSWIETLLRKLYVVPFDEAHPPRILSQWLIALVDYALNRKQGFKPNQRDGEDYRKAADDAKAEIKLAASSKDGMFDLPLREGESASGAVKVVPFCYSETSPYVSRQVTHDVGTHEDTSGSGTWRGR